MKNSGKKILVTGATGRQGGAVARHLLKNNFIVKAITRTPGSIAAQQLIFKGAEIFKGDISDTRFLNQVMSGCDAVFSIQNYFECGAENEIQFGKNMVDAAKKNNIIHFIYNSVCCADSNTGVPHFETKNTIEKYIKSSGLQYTIFRPVKFMENYYIPQVFKGILTGKLYDSINPGKKHQLIAIDDIGKYVANAISLPENYMNKTIEIAGDELTNEEIASTMAEVLGIKVKFKRLPMLAVRMLMDKEMYLMFKWFNQKGFEVNIEQNKKNMPEVKVSSLKDFLVSENWQRWNYKGTV